MCRNDPIVTINYLTNYVEVLFWKTLDLLADLGCFYETIVVW